MKGYYGEGIRHYRKIRDAKQEALATALNMSRQNLSKIEQNLQKIEDNMLVIVARELNTTPEKIKAFKNADFMTDPPSPVEPQKAHAAQTSEQIWKTLSETLEANRDFLRLQDETIRSHTETMRINSEMLQSCADALQQVYQQLSMLRVAT
jgi:transcriptional regulator with XRE-family HTH domain